MDSDFQNQKVEKLVVKLDEQVIQRIPIDKTVIDAVLDGMETNRAENRNFQVKKRRKFLWVIALCCLLLSLLIYLFGTYYVTNGSEKLLSASPDQIYEVAWSLNRIAVACNFFIWVLGAIGVLLTVFEIREFYSRSKFKESTI